MSEIYVEMYQGKSKQAGRQAWRWRAVNEGNNRKLANGGEAYANQQDCVDAIEALFGPGTTIRLRHPDRDIPSVVRVGTL